MERIRLRPWHTVPSVRRSDSTEHVPQARQPAPHFDYSTNAAHNIPDSATVLQLARTKPRVRPQRIPANVLHHRIHHRTRLGFIRVPRQALATGPCQWHHAHRRHTGHPVCPTGARDIQRVGYPVHRRLLLLQEQDIRNHRRGSGPQPRRTVRIIRTNRGNDCCGMRLVADVARSQARASESPASGNLGTHCDLHGLVCWKIHLQRDACDGGRGRPGHRHDVEGCELLSIRQGVAPLRYRYPPFEVEFCVACYQEEFRGPRSTPSAHARRFAARYLRNRLWNT